MKFISRVLFIDFIDFAFEIHCVKHIQTFHSNRISDWFEY